MSDRPRDWPLYRDCAGRRFQLLRNVKNGAGDVFPAGTVLIAGRSNTMTGMTFSAETKCPCGIRHGLRGLDPSDLRLLP